jgi:hypothetical protein
MNLIMIELVLKNDIQKEKMDALLHFLKSWDIDIEIKNIPQAKKSNKDFSLSAGIWKDYDINATELRKQAWKISK